MILSSLFNQSPSSLTRFLLLVTADTLLPGRQYPNVGIGGGQEEDGSTWGEGRVQAFWIPIEEHLAMIGEGVDVLEEWEDVSSIDLFEIVDPCLFTLRHQSLTWGMSI